MSRAKRKLQPPPDTLTSLDFVEGMARIRGYEAFRHNDTAEVCWHCDGRRLCNCASCVFYTDKLEGLSWQGKPAKCVACQGSGLLTWLEVA